MRHFNWRRTIRISIVTHAAENALVGNRITTSRWSKILRELGHRVSVNRGIDDCDVFVAVHAEHCGSLLTAFRRKYPNRPALLLLAGTDVYSSGGFSKRAIAAIDNASRLITLEANAQLKLKSRWREKTNVIPQSAQVPKTIPPPLKSSFEIAVCANLRSVKQPFFAAQAAQRLPVESKIRINHYGSPLSAKMKTLARQWMEKSNRYHWLGSKEHWRCRSLIARSRVLVNTSLSESSANSIVESLVAGTPVLATRVLGNTAVLGTDYPGLFSTDSISQLTDLMNRVESDSRFLGQIKKNCQRLAKNHSRAAEKKAWRRLFAQLT